MTSQTVFAEEFNNLVVSEQEYIAVEGASIRDIMQSPLYYPLYSSIPQAKAEAIVEFYSQIERIKLDNPHLSLEELVSLIDEMCS